MNRSISIQLGKKDMEALQRAVLSLCSFERRYDECRLRKPQERTSVARSDSEFAASGFPGLTSMISHLHGGNIESRIHADDTNKIWLAGGSACA